MNWEFKKKLVSLYLYYTGQLKMVLVYHNCIYLFTCFLFNAVLKNNLLTYMKAASITVVGNQSVPLVNSQPTAGCCKAFPHTEAYSIYLCELVFKYFYTALRDNPS